mgnify:CR=1 FL=1
MNDIQSHWLNCDSSFQVLKFCTVNDRFQNEVIDFRAFVGLWKIGNQEVFDLILFEFS